MAIRLIAEQALWWLVMTFATDVRLVNRGASGGPMSGPGQPPIGVTTLC